MTIKTNTKTKATDNFNYEVLEDIADLGKRGKYTLKLRYVSFNGKDPKYDIRPWGVDDEGNERMAKGISLSGEELQALKDILNKGDKKAPAKSTAKKAPAKKS